MIWTLITFGIAVFILWKYAFGPLQKIIDQRRDGIQESMDVAEETRAEALRLLEEYKATLAKVRGESEEILERSRTTGEHAKAEIMAEAKAQSERVLAKAHEQIERDTRAALRDIKGQIAELTALATEKVAAQQPERGRPAAPHRRGARRARRREARRGGQGVSEEQVARVYAQALFDAAREAGAVAPVRRELGEFVAALAASASLRNVLADPQVDTAAKRRVLAEITRGGQPLVANTLQLMLERGRFAAVPELHQAYDALAIVGGGRRRGRGRLGRGARRPRPRRRSPPVSRRPPGAGSSWPGASTPPSSAASSCASATSSSTAASKHASASCAAGWLPQK